MVTICAAIPGKRNDTAISPRYKRISMHRFNASISGLAFSKRKKSELEIPAYTRELGCLLKLKRRWFATLWVATALIVLVMAGVMVGFCQAQKGPILVTRLSL